MRPYTRCPVLVHPWASDHFAEPCADLWAGRPAPAYDAVMAPVASPRIEPLPHEEWDDVLTRVLEGSSGGTEAPMHIFTTLARAPGDLFRRWLGFGGALLGGTLPARLREVVILRTAYRFDGRYEWAQHIELAERAGVSVAGDHRTRWRSGLGGLVAARAGRPRRRGRDGGSGRRH